MALVKVLVERRPSDLKLGYRTVLTIIADKNTSTTANQIIPVAEGFFLFVEMDDEQRERRHQARRRGNGKAEKILAAAAAGMADRHVEPRQPERAAEQINGGDEPADLPVFAEHVRQHDALHQKRRRHAEGNQIRQRIEFAPERAFRAAQPRHAAVQQIKNARQQNEREREFDLAEIVIGLAGSASTILVSATKPQNRLPAVSRFGRK